MDFSSLLSLDKASPLALVVLVTAWLVHRVFMFLEARFSKKEEAQEVARQVSHEKVCNEISKVLSSHCTQEDERTKQMIGVLSQMEQHLVLLSSSQTGVMSKRTQRLIVQYQWNWCRDEVIRIAVNSVRRNGIKNAEEAVVTRLVSAWRGAAKDAKESLGRLESITITYEPLFDGLLLSIIPSVWEWMLPLYGMRGAELDMNLESLTLKIRELFEQALDGHVTTQIEAEADTEETLRNRTGEFPTTNIISRMADGLRRRALKEPV